MSTIQADLDTINKIPMVSSILEVICRTTGMGFAAVARVTEDRWVACMVKDDISFGLKAGGELNIETTICNEIRHTGREVVIDHVENDPLFKDHHTPAMYGFQSYISVPIVRRDGSFFGTLCAIDPNSHKLNTPETRSMFNLYADLISFHIQAVEELAVSESSLQEERKTAELREQFIAVLGHDLRNPLSAASNGAELLSQMPLQHNAIRVANIIKDSCYRMNGMITNVLDFARGRLGGGISLTRKPLASIDKLLTQVISEMRVVWSDRVIITQFDITRPLNFDEQRIGQLFSNLLGNALTYGRPDSPVMVGAMTANHAFILTVSNEGPEIPPAIRERLFKPFSRAGHQSTHSGLGLGLYIASEIAAAHGGGITVSSNNTETKFTLRIPI